MSVAVPPANRAPKMVVAFLNARFGHVGFQHFHAATAPEDTSMTATQGRDGAFSFDFRKVFGSRISRPSLDQLGSPIAIQPCVIR